MDKISPEYYKSHPSGVECIDITRHYCFDIGNAIKYLWRAGLKQEEGYTSISKEIEDLHKAIWYIEDRIKQLNSMQKQSINELSDRVSDLLLDPVGQKEPCVIDDDLWDNTIRDYAKRESKRIKKVKQCNEEFKKTHEKETKENN